MQKYFYLCVYLISIQYASVYSKPHWYSQMTFKTITQRPNYIIYKQMVQKIMCSKLTEICILSPFFSSSVLLWKLLQAGPSFYFYCFPAITNIFLLHSYNNGVGQLFKAFPSTFNKRKYFSATFTDIHSNICPYHQNNFSYFKHLI